MRKQMTTADALRAAQAAEWAAGHVAKAAAARNDRNAVPQTQELERAAHVEMIHCLFGNPFRPVAFDPAWRTPEVQALARAIYDERAFGRMKRLASALRQAGCADKEILGHCRHKGDHYRGCWVVDLLLEAPSPVAQHQGPSLEAVLREVSEVNLRGQPVPPVLRALWEAQLAGEMILGLGFNADETLFAGKFQEDLMGWSFFNTPDKKLRQATQKMLGEIGFISSGSDIVLLGYWFYDDAITVDRAPIVWIDTEGTYKLGGASLEDHLLLGAYEMRPDNVPAIKRWLKRHNLPVRSRRAIEQRCIGLPDPDERSWEYHRG
jgi:hypothetical protein